MKELSKIVWVIFGIIIGFGFAIGMKNIPTAVAGNDRHEDFVMATKSSAEEILRLFA